MKLRKAKTCLPIVLSKRLDPKNFAINAINFANAATDHAHPQIVKVLKYDLTETSHLDSYMAPLN